MLLAPEFGYRFPLLLFPRDAIDIHQVQLIGIGDRFNGVEGHFPFFDPD